MQRHTETEALDTLSASIMHRFDVGPGLARGLKHPAADLAEIAAILGDREDRKQPIAHELQNHHHACGSQEPGNRNTG